MGCGCSTSVLKHASLVQPGPAPAAGQAGAAAGAVAPGGADDPLNVIPDNGSYSQDYEVTLAPASLLGKGSFGVVYLGRHRQTGETVAIKLMRRGKVKPTSIAREYTVLQHLGSHPAIVGYRGAYKTAEEVAFVFELMTHGELFTRLITVGAVAEAEARVQFCYITHALRYLHARGIVHRDVKPENVLMTTPAPLHLHTAGPSATATAASGSGASYTVTATGPGQWQPAGYSAQAAGPGQHVHAHTAQGAASASAIVPGIGAGGAIGGAYGSAPGSSSTFGSTGCAWKLSDFGLSQLVGPQERLLKVCGTWAYSAPEMSAHDKRGYDCKFDCFSLGVVRPVVGGVLTLVTNVAPKPDVAARQLYLVSWPHLQYHGVRGSCCLRYSSISSRSRFP